MLERSCCAFSSIVVPPNSFPSAMALTSPPAQKPRLAPVSTTTPTAESSASRCSASSIAPSMGPDSAFSRSGRFIVSTAMPSLTVSSSSVVIRGSSRTWIESRSGRGRQRPHVRDQRTDLIVGQMIAEGGHAWLADGGAAVLDQGEEVVVGKGSHRSRISEIARPDEENGGAPRSAAIRAMTGRAVTEIGALRGRRLLWNGVRHEEQGEKTAGQ